MKLQLVLLVSASLLLSLTLNAQKPVTQVMSQNQPYKLQYNNLKFGNPVYAQKVMEAWKQWENNQMDGSLMADHVVGYFSDGTVIKGADNANNLFKAVRNSFASVLIEVYACTTLKSPDDPEHEFVVIWGRETDTKKDGSVQKTRLHEVWRFNREGKADQCLQYVIPENSANGPSDQPAQARNNAQGYPILKDLILGHPAYSQVVLKVWKDFENNSMDNSRAFFSDEVVAYSPIGTVINGKENVLKASNDYRNSLNSVKFEISGCTTLKSPSDPDHEIVMIWAERTYTNNDGSIQKTNGQEAWYFNKQGKIDKIYQFSAAVPVDR